MDLKVQLCAYLHADPGALVVWLHTLIRTYAIELAWPKNLILGPHTFTASAPTPYETVALYVVNEQMSHDIPTRKVALALTYLPLRQPGIGLDIRVWPPFPATLERVTYLFFTHFANANPVSSSVADLTYSSVYSSGAPPLACNLWVREQLADPVFANMELARRLYPAWLEQYRALRGSYPADPRRAFRSLLARHRRQMPG
jgi:hypothetical protein